MESPLSGRDEPLEALIYVSGVTSFNAEVWETRVIKPFQQTINYTFWIYVTDKNFAGREILDSRDSINNTIDINFLDTGMRDLKGFRFCHFAGNIFRVKFTLNLVSGSVVEQDLKLEC